MASITVRVTKNNFGVAAAAGQQAMWDHGSLKAAQMVVELAQARAKVDTGRMRAETTASGGPTNATARAGAPYSGFLNWGTRYIAPDYWFTDPVEQVRSSWPNELGSALTAAYHGAA